MRDLYKTLGVTKSATADDIKKAYRTARASATTRTEPGPTTPPRRSSRRSRPRTRRSRTRTSARPTTVRRVGGMGARLRPDASTTSRAPAASTSGPARLLSWPRPSQQGGGWRGPRRSAASTCQTTSTSTLDDGLTGVADGSPCARTTPADLLGTRAAPARPTTARVQGAAASRRATRASSAVRPVLLRQLRHRHRAPVPDRRRPRRDTRRQALHRADPGGREEDGAPHPLPGGAATAAAAGERRPLRSVNVRRSWPVFHAPRRHSRSTCRHVPEDRARHEIEVRDGSASACASRCQRQRADGKVCAGPRRADAGRRDLLVRSG